MLLTADILPHSFYSNSPYEPCLEYILLCGVLYSLFPVQIRVNPYVYTGFTSSPVTHLKLYELL